MESHRRKSTLSRVIRTHDRLHLPVGVDFSLRPDFDCRKVRFSGLQRSYEKRWYCRWSTHSKWYDQQKLTPIKIDQIAFWDETHKKVKPGNTAAYDQDEVLTFPRDANGKVDVENGTYQEVQLAKLQCKYTDEVRLCIGVSATKNEGKVLGTFVYTNKTLLTINDWNKK